MNNNELKPCPFCGGNTKLGTNRKSVRDARFEGETYVYEWAYKITAYISCTFCHARGGVAVGFVGSGITEPSEQMKRKYNFETYGTICERARKKWNARAEE